MIRDHQENKIALMSAAIRRRREALGLTQAEAAVLAGMKQANYSRMESGRQTPNLETLLSILSALRLDMRFCLNDETICHIMHRDDTVADAVLSHDRKIIRFRKYEADGLRQPFSEKKLTAEALVMISGSSVGTQAKYFDKGYWYKADKTGAESTAEHLVSCR